MSKILSRSDILGCDDMRSQTLEIPEWGGSVRIRSLTGAEREAFEANLYRLVDGRRELELENFRAKLAAACIVDEEDRQIFSAADVLALAKKSSVALARIFNAAEALNGMHADAVAGAQKNSASGPTGASTSDSPLP